MTDEVPKVTKRVNDIRQQLDNPMIADADAADEKVIKFLSMQVSDFDKMKARSEKLQEYQAILKLNVDEFELLGGCSCGSESKSAALEGQKRMGSAARKHSRYDHQRPRRP